jgi:YggT family protein
MSTLASIIMGIGGILHSLLTIYIWVIIIAALLSWVRPDPYNPIVQFLTRITEPAYYFVRRLIPTTFNGIDFAPLIIIIGLQVIDVILISLLNALAASV